MKTRNCQAFVESTGRRCEKNVRWGRKYCWWHYPKAGPVWALILGAFLGLILTLLFNGPLMALLSRYQPFHYLDRNNPIILGVIPDIRASEYVDADTRTFSLTFRDDCSGLDLARCSIDLCCLKDEEYVSLNGNLTTRTNRLDFTVNTELGCGEYILRATVFDRANNGFEYEYQFVVPEEEIIDISAVYEEYKEAKHEKLFRSFLDERAAMLDQPKQMLFVYRIGLHNKAEKTYCKSLHFSIDCQAVIYCWKEMSAFECKGIVSLSTTEAMQKNIPKDIVFTSQRILSIDEIGPGGLAGFAALVGFMKFDKVRPKVNTPGEIGVFGTYVSEGYGRTKIEDIRRWIPIKKRNSDN